MKRFTSWLMVVTLVVMLVVPVVVGVAESGDIMPLAYDGSFAWHGKSTSFTRWTYYTGKAEGTTWYISWKQANVATTPAKVKVFTASGAYASHTFYYSTLSYAPHNYLDTISEGNGVYLQGACRYENEEIELNGTGVFVP